MGDDATLRDASTTDAAATTTTTTTDAAKTTDATTTTTTATTDAATHDVAAEELGRILLSSGITKDQINDVLAAPQALAALRHAIQNDPGEFVKMLERSDPATAEKFTEGITDFYLKRNAVEDPKTGETKRADPLTQEIRALKEQVSSMLTKDQQRDQALALAATRQRYDARVDDMFGIKELKELNLTKAETKAMRAQLDQVLSKDPLAVQRVSNGNFVDVPGAFKSIVEEWAGDRKTAAAEAAKARERSKSNAFNEFMNGPEFTSEIPATTFDDWDSTAEAMAKALASTGR